MNFLFSDVAAEREAVWGGFFEGFFRKNGSNQVFYASRYRGGGKFSHAVLEDGTISRQPTFGLIISKDEIVELINPARLGIEKIVWAA